jgi:hypothetical protein
MYATRKQLEAYSSMNYDLLPVGSQGILLDD